MDKRRARTDSSVMKLLLLNLEFRSFDLSVSFFFLWAMHTVYLGFQYKVRAESVCKIGINKKRVRIGPH
jgi:hypothetical protein